MSLTRADDLAVPDSVPESDVGAEVATKLVALPCSQQTFYDKPVFHTRKYV